MFRDSSDLSEMLKFQLGHGGVILGVDEGVFGMCVNERRRLVLPPHLSDEKKTIVYDVQLTSIHRDVKNY